MKNLLILIVFSVCIISCQKSESRRESLKSNTSTASVVPDQDLAYEDEMELVPPRTAEPPPPKAREQQEKTIAKIIKDGSMTMEVESLNEPKGFIDSIVAASSAYYENESFNENGSQYRYTL